MAGILPTGKYPRQTQRPRWLDTQPAEILHLAEDFFIHYFLPETHFLVHYPKAAVISGRSCLLQSSFTSFCKRDSQYPARKLQAGSNKNKMKARSKNLVTK